MQQNWGDMPFLNATTLWYRGHARMDPYSIVRFDTLDTETVEQFSSYVVRDGEVLSTNCDDGTVVVRPWGSEDECPPSSGNGVPGGMEERY